MSKSANHPCAAAGCARYRKAKLPDRIMRWCNILHTPMAPCFNLLPSAGAQQGQDLSLIHISEPTRPY